MIFSCFTRRSFQNVLQPWWTVYNDFYPVETEVTSNLLSLAWRFRLHPIVGSNDPKPDPIYASLQLAFHPKCALSARKCIAQYRFKFQIIHCQFLPGSAPALGLCPLSNHSEINVNVSERNVDRKYNGDKLTSSPARFIWNIKTVMWLFLIWNFVFRNNFSEKKLFSIFF